MVFPCNLYAQAHCSQIVLNFPWLVTIWDQDKVEFKSQLSCIFLLVLGSSVGWEIAHPSARRLAQCVA